jgi:hypothetical protein
MRKIAYLIFLPLFLFSCKHENFQKPSKTAAQDEALKLNQIQVLASHNSYRIRTTDTVLHFLFDIQKLLPASLNPNDLDYTHLPIEAQMSDYGMRGLEIDIYNDPQGGLFASRRINSYVALPEASGIAELNETGFKVLHIKDIDYNTHFYTFKQGLQKLKNWSDAHPNHLPIFVNIETKTESPGDDSTLASLGFLPAIEYDDAAADALDAEVKSVFGENLDKILTPDKLRGSLSTLNEVVLQNKYPNLGECRNKIIFIMEGDLVNFYKKNHASLKGRAMFIYAKEGTPEAVFVIKNGPVNDQYVIEDLVKQGYMVRTRADSGTEQARTGDYTDMIAAFASGAQIISTDYYKADERAGQTGWTDYKVNFPNKELARKNPVNAVNVKIEAALSE